MAHKLWKVTYSYKAAHIDGTSSLRQSYLVVAANQEEALKKGDECFSYSDENKQLLAKNESHSSGHSLYDLYRNAAPYQTKIPLPRLTLKSDKAYIDLKATIAFDGKMLEFIVLEK